MKLHNTVEEYIKDPETRVFISHNDEAGVWQHSVVVDGSNGFWLDSFDTEQEALDFIESYNLKMVV